MALSKLDLETANKIRKTYMTKRSEGMTQKKIARSYGISEAAVAKIINNQTWKKDGKRKTVVNSVQTDDSTRDRAKIDACMERPESINHWSWLLGVQA